MPEIENYLAFKEILQWRICCSSVEPLVYVKQSKAAVSKNGHTNLEELKTTTITGHFGKTRSYAGKSRDYRDAIVF